jgi:hypothetical protein
MDAYKYFATIAKPNYEDAKRNSDELRFLWNAIVSLNTVPEFLALDQLDYDLDLDRQTLDIEADKIREKFPALRTLKNARIHSNMCAAFHESAMTLVFQVFLRLRLFRQRINQLG